MKNLTYLITGAAFFISVLAVKPAIAQDPVDVDGKHYTVAFENSAVRVLRVKYGAKEKSAMHAHPDAVVVPLTSTRGRFTLADGKKQVRTLIAGQPRWTPAETHLPQNLGANPFEVILVELKGGGAGSTPAADGDALKADPRHHKLEFENDRVRVLRAKIGARAKSKMHSHPANVVIALTPAHVKSVSADGTAGELNVKKGEVVYRDALSHQSENLGKQPLEVIIVELK